MLRIVVLVLSLVVACRAQMVTSAGQSASPYAPVNEVGRYGLIKYPNDGAQFLVKKLRENAYKQMFNSCRGPYRIVAEGQRVEGGVVVSGTKATTSGTDRDSGTKATVRETGSGASVRTSGSTTSVDRQTESTTTTSTSDVHYWYIQYQCTRPDSA